MDYKESECERCQEVKSERQMYINAFEQIKALQNILFERNKLLKEKDLIITELSGKVGQLKKQLAKVTAERDAAIEDLRGQCGYCYKEKDCVTRKGPHWNCWEWRGVKED